MGERPPRVKAIAGTAVVVFLLATSRWGSNIGAAPLFITDLLIALPVFQILSKDSSKPEPPRDGWATRSVPGVFFGLFVTYVVVRMVTAIGNGPIVVWARDGVPYLYAFLACISAYSLARSTESNRSRTSELLWKALLVHLGWSATVTLAGIHQSIQPPLFGAPPFQIRPDIDAALLAVTAAVAARRWMLRQHRGWSAMVALLAIATVLNLGTRAGFLSLVAALALTVFVTYAGSTSRARTTIVLSLPILMVAAAIVLVTTTPGQRLIATIDPSQASTEAQYNAQGTQRARQLVWGGIVEWVGQENDRFFFGSGFGNDFLAESGTLDYLQGTTYTGVRSPHNWFVGTYARLGLIGVILLAGALLQLLKTVMSARRRVASDDLLFTCAVLVVAFLPIATLGVVLEAPFGAVPFWWAAGAVYAITPLTRQSERRRAQAAARLEVTAGRYRAGSAYAQPSGRR